MKRCNLSRFLMFSIIIMMFVSCKKEKNESNLPLVKTVEVSNIDETTVTCGGNIASDGNSKVTERGVCWSAVSNATILGNHTSDGSGIGSFTSNISGLTGNMTYYVRAYATNSVGTAYGEEKVFKTKQTNNSLPTVSSANVSNISSTTATCGGNVTSDGNSAVTAKGVCWSISQNPTIANNKTNNGQGLGAFTSNITGLSTGTTYYVRAYATNSSGTGYGSAMSFTTQEGSSGGTFTDTRDGKVYQTVVIGTQEWMAENLAYLPSVVSPGTGSNTTSYYYVYGYDGASVSAAKSTANYTTYGVLYNWPAAMNSSASSSANPSGVQGVCPTGWHLPSDAEWTELTDYLGGESVAGVTALPGGYRLSNGSFNFIGNFGYWWSATEISPISAWGRSMFASDSDVGSYFHDKELGFSVRCLRD